MCGEKIAPEQHLFLIANRLNPPRLLKTAISTNLITGSRHQQNRRVATLNSAQLRFLAGIPDATISSSGNLCNCGFAGGAFGVATPRMFPAVSSRCEFSACFSGTLSKSVQNCSRYKRTVFCPDMPYENFESVVAGQRKNETAGREAIDPPCILMCSWGRSQLFWR